ncbi:MAG: outer membrane beta-barrel protein [Pseudomonadales bacterium]
MLWNGGAGGVWSLTANVNWQLNGFVRIRPEIKFHSFDAESGSRGLFDDGQEDDQMVVLLNLFVQF